MNRRMTYTACAAFALAIFGTSAYGSDPSTVADLASALQGQREVCAKMAADAKEAYSTAQFQSGLDRETAELKAKMDAQVYGVGHGSRETFEYYLQQTQNADSAQDAKNKDISDRFNASTEQVTHCVSDEERKGKSAYVTFKEHHTRKSVRAEAEALMTAWLTNIREISTGSPSGGDASFAAWRAAKAHAEVSSL